MPINPTYPGVYIQESPQDVHHIAGASTSNTAFVDVFARGPVNQAVRLSSFSDFERYFGGLDHRSEASYQIMQYYRNGGRTCYALRVVPSTVATASADVGGAPKSRLRLRAATPGAWGNSLRAVTMKPRPQDNPATFTLQVQQIAATGKVDWALEFTGLSPNPAESNYCVDRVSSQSDQVELVDDGAAFPMPTLVARDSSGLQSGAAYQSLSGGSDGAWNEAAGEFAAALRDAVSEATSPLLRLAPDRFNILCIPATAKLDASTAGPVMAQAQACCEAGRAFYLVDIPDSQKIPSPRAMADWRRANREYLTSGCAAVYYPRLKLLDPTDKFHPRESSNSGTLAGLYASNDLARGVWKAPSGAQATLTGATLAYTMSDAENAILNPLGVNALRTFPVYGPVSWGARTLQGADELASTWKYVPVRRLAQYIENSLYSELTWAAREPNGPPLWNAIVQTVSGFVSNLFKQGALQGSSAKDAYFVKCDATTTTRPDIDRGRLNVAVGFAPLRPAEFVILNIPLMAGPPA